MKTNRHFRAKRKPQKSFDSLRSTVNCLIFKRHGRESHLNYLTSCVLIYCFVNKSQEVQFRLRNFSLSFSHHIFYGQDGNATYHPNAQIFSLVLNSTFAPFNVILATIGDLSLFRTTLLFRKNEILNVYFI